MPPEPTSTDFEVLFEDANLIVISKAPGLLSQAADSRKQQKTDSRKQQNDSLGNPSHEKNLVDLLRERFGRHYVGLVHRLDRNTSGLMVVAKRSKAADRLSEQLRNGELIRKYTAFLWGDLTAGKTLAATKTDNSGGSTLRLDHWLLKNEKTNEVRMVPPKTPGSKAATLFLKPLKTITHPRTQDLLTLAEFELETGRSHQIRAQTNAIGHPLIGDQKYGNDKSLTLFHRPALHSCFLSFSHPISKERMTFEQRYSVDMIDFFSTKLE